MRSRKNTFAVSHGDYLTRFAGRGSHFEGVRDFLGSLTNVVAKLEDNDRHQELKLCALHSNATENTGVSSYVVSRVVTQRAKERWTFPAETTGSCLSHGSRRGGETTKKKKEESVEPKKPVKATFYDATTKPDLKCVLCYRPHQITSCKT